MAKSLLSVGIDLGTSTTQLIFSRIYLVDVSMCAVPNVKIAKKEILYRSAIYFTPLVSSTEIDLPAVEKILQEEYKKAGVAKEDIETGAIIITGETARKENAASVLSALSSFAGDFVVATAGPDLEAVLAGYGAGAAERSKHTNGAVVNFDIGGGTTNAAVFANGQVTKTFALDIGGRLIRLDKAYTVTYISPRIQPLLQELGISLQVGQGVDLAVLQQVTDAFAQVLWKMYHGQALTAGEGALGITPLPSQLDCVDVTFSGGVASCVYAAQEVTTLADVTTYGDIGPLLGQSIRQRFFAQTTMVPPVETIRATVIGAGNHSLHISGSTVYIDETVLPLKNIPVVYGEGLDATDIATQMALFPQDMVAISLVGKRSPSYTEIKALATLLHDAVQAYVQREKIIVILLEADVAKALGMTLQQLLPQTTVICLDNIHARSGDYIDIGKPVSNVVPVVVKTLIFKA